MKCRARLFEEIVESMQQVRALWVEVKENCEPAPAAEAWIPPMEQASASGAWSA
jgi:hypothetical protein